MLVLSRQRDETIMIGDEVEITVVDIRGDKVRLGISAPSRIAVHRKEVYEAIKAENRQAANVGDDDVEPLRSAVRPGASRGARAANLRGGGSVRQRDASPNQSPPGGASQSRPDEGARRRA